MATERPNRRPGGSERDGGWQPGPTSGGRPLEYFPAALACLLPGFGQIVNQRHVPRQWVKGFMFSWFFWLFVLGKGDSKFYLPAAILFAWSAFDFVWTRRNYNRRLAALQGRGG